MIIMFFIFAFTAFLFSSFTISFKLQTINRAIIYMPVEVFETAIPLVNVDISNGLYFDKTKLNKNVNNYLQSKLTGVMKDYTYSLYYYNQEDESICTSDKCNAVEVTVNGHYAYNFTYTRSVSYEIHKGAKYGQWKDC